MAKRTLPAWMREDQRKESKDVQISNEGKSMSSTRVLPPSIADPNLLEKNLPYLEYHGRIHYTHIKDECNFVCYDILQSSSSMPSVCGFDMEWKVNYGGLQGKTAVVQICMSGQTCHIFHLAAMNGFPVELKNLVESEDITKAGIGINGDMSKLMRDFNIKPTGTADLSTISNNMNKTQENWSLNGLLINLFKKRLSKDKNVRCSNWEQYPLTEKQLDYAATDAYASLILYEKLQENAF